ncbi:MAG: penicillin-binding transpeptidase domain-containing protein [Gammaproteobacteria bacterium]|nr:penicillin-binding transpeptidase domain-containing protein [Gammaproteobacteria bacterium]
MNHISNCRFRRYLVMSVFVLAMLGLLWRALDMQVLNQAFFQQQGDARHLRTVTVPANRGDIYDRNGEPLAISTPVDSVWVNPAEFNVDVQRLQLMADMLEQDARALRQRVDRSQQREFLYIKRHVEPHLAEKIMALGLPGVYLQREYKRYYPAGEVTAHVLGFANVDDHGQEGLELAYDDWLSGQEGSKQIIRDRLGRAIDDVERLKAVEPGKVVAASLDKRVQYLAYRALKAAVKEHDAKAGSAVMLDARTGEVLAMVNLPSFNTNNRTQLKPGVYRNRAVTDVFEPGSTMKPLTIAAAIESGRWDHKDNVRTAPGYMRVQGNLIKDHRNYGKLDLGGILLKSSNVGISKVALSLDQEQQLDMYMSLGLGASTGSGFPGESSGKINVAHLGEFERAAMAFGYGVAVTPLQLARAYAALANGGLMYPVSFVQLKEPPEGVRVMSETTARQVRTMMEKVVTQEGTGWRAQVPNYRVAGKTGTVHKSVAGGYAEDRYQAIFAGMAPASDPHLVLVVMLDEPSNGQYFGGQVASPVFAKVMAGALRLLDIPPDNLKLAVKKAGSEQA